MPCHSFCGRNRVWQMMESVTAVAAFCYCLVFLCSDFYEVMYLAYRTRVYLQVAQPWQRPHNSYCAFSAGDNFFKIQLIFDQLSAVLQKWQNCVFEPHVGRLRNSLVASSSGSWKAHGPLSRVITLTPVALQVEVRQFSVSERVRYFGSQCSVED